MGSCRQRLEEQRCTGAVKTLLDKSTQISKPSPIYWNVHAVCVCHCRDLLERAAVCVCLCRQNVCVPNYLSLCGETCAVPAGQLRSELAPGIPMPETRISCLFVIPFVSVNSETKNTR